MTTSTQKQRHAAVAGSTKPSGSANPSGSFLRVKGLCKSYHKGKLEIPVLRGVDLALDEGHFTSIVGQSGSGKSTLLHLLGTLDAPDAGEIHFEGKRIDNIPIRKRDALRNRDFGMIFQFYHLLPELTTLENVLLPSMIESNVMSFWRGRSQKRERAEELLQMVGLGHRAKHKPRELSGGEMQRVAIARALIARPRLLLADEPTGNLDEKTSGEIMELLRCLNEETKLTIVMVTHDLAVAGQSHRTVRLTKGQIEPAPHSAVA